MKRLQQAEANGAKLVGEVVQAGVTADSARRAAEEIAAWIFKLEQPLTSETDLTVTSGIVEAIISKHFAAAAPADNGAELKGET